MPYILMNLFKHNSHRPSGGLSTKYPHAADKQPAPPPYKSHVHGRIKFQKGGRLRTRA